MSTLSSPVSNVHPIFAGILNGFTAAPVESPTVARVRPMPDSVDHDEECNEMRRAKFAIMEDGSTDWDADFGAGPYRVNRDEAKRSDTFFADRMEASDIDFILELARDGKADDLMEFAKKLVDRRNRFDEDEDYRESLR